MVVKPALTKLHREVSSPLDQPIPSLPTPEEPEVGVGEEEELVVGGGLEEGVPVDE
jgi:hypothetical protein